MAWVSEDSVTGSSLRMSPSGATPETLVMVYTGCGMAQEALCTYLHTFIFTVYSLPRMLTVSTIHIGLYTLYARVS